jgi:hypothetical protein
MTQVIRAAGPPGRVDQEKHLHDVFRRRVRGLHDEHIVAAHVLVDANRDLSVGEPTEIDPT